jgi:hypothetical protein
MNFSYSIPKENKDDTGASAESSSSSNNNLPLHSAGNSKPATRAATVMRAGFFMDPRPSVMRLPESLDSGSGLKGTTGLSGTSKGNVNPGPTSLPKPPSVRKSSSSRRILEESHPFTTDSVYLVMDEKDEEKAKTQASVVQDVIVKFLTGGRHWSKKGKNYRIIGTYEHNFSSTYFEIFLYRQNSTGKYFLEIQRRDSGHIAFCEIKLQIFWLLYEMKLASTYVNGDEIYKPWSLIEKEREMKYPEEDDDGLGMPSVMGTGLGGNMSGIQLYKNMEVVDIWLDILENTESSTKLIQDTLLTTAKTTKGPKNCIILARNRRLMKLVYRIALQTHDAQIATCGAEVLVQCMKVDKDLASDLKIDQSSLLRFASKFAGINLSSGKGNAKSKAFTKSSFLVPWRALEICNCLTASPYTKEDMHLVEKMEKKFKRDETNMGLLRNLRSAWNAKGMPTAIPSC